MDRSSYSRYPDRCDAVQQELYFIYVHVLPVASPVAEAERLNANERAELYSSRQSE